MSLDRGRKGSRVYIEHKETEYPVHIYGYAPSEKYPEYLWDDISEEKNEIYDMVRNCLKGYGLDREHFGTTAWNPLGDIISEGNTVVIKPNWVEDKNENRHGGMECLVTHASVIRAVIDYVYLALKGSGKIIIGDSAMPNCNFEHLMEVAHYNEVWTSCRERDIRLKVVDFRDDIVKGFANAIQETEENSEMIVDLGKNSLFAETEQHIGKYRNGIVDAKMMNEYYHAEGHHRYGINKSVLEADVIINLPKPKTHRKAGYTAALKNYIGICSRKISIPHNVMGNEKEGGDTYYGPKVIFETEQRMRDVQNNLQTEKRNIEADLMKCLRIPFWAFRRMTHKYFFGTGNWYKNDTIWRAILDLNRIMIYADKRGRLQDAPQRRFFTVGDMIVAGHRNGPLAPTPIKMGILLCSEDPVAFDLSVIQLMGLDYDYLPVLNRIPKIKEYPLQWNDFSDINIFSNEKMLDGKSVANMSIAPYGFFEPAEGWGIISMKDKK